MDRKYLWFVFGWMFVVSCVLTVSGVAHADLNDGLVAHYPFNGNARDESGNFNDGSVNGATLVNDRFGNPNSAYKFDGNDFIDIGNNVKPEFPITVSAWVNIDDITPGDFGHGIIFQNDDYDRTSRYFGFNVHNFQGHLGCSIGNGGIASSSSRADMGTNEIVFSENVWIHIVVIINDFNDMRFFVDSSEFAADSSTGNATTMVYSSAPGKIGLSNTLPFDGNIDDIRIYNRALSESEILELFNEGSDIPPLTPTPDKPTPTPTASTTPPSTTTPVPITPTPTLKPTSTPVIPTPTPEPTVCVAPVADFIASTTTGKIPLTVNFTDISEGNPNEWFWDFGDGGKSTSKNPTHKYELIGKYTVSLTVTNECGEGEEIKNDFINALPIKSFTFKCGKEFLLGARGLETLVMELGLNEQCELTLTHLEPGVLVDVATFIRSGIRSSVQVEPLRATADANGELEINITAVNKGIDWVAWAVPNDKGEFEFSKKAYDSGLAWGMFIEVRR